MLYETDFYNGQKQRYLHGTEEQRIESKNHWIKCHIKNLKDKRDDLIIFSAQILAMYVLADFELKQNEQE